MNMIYKDVTSSCDCDTAPIIVVVATATISSSSSSSGGTTNSLQGATALRLQE